MPEKTDRDYYVNKAYSGLTEFLDANRELYRRGDDTITRLIIDQCISMRSLYLLLFKLDKLERRDAE